jgi:hypothetical protein
LGYDRFLVKIAIGPKMRGHISIDKRRANYSFPFGRSDKGRPREVRIGAAARVTGSPPPRDRSQSPAAAPADRAGRPLSSVPALEHLLIR